MSQQNENIIRNDKNQDEDQIILNEEELDPVELIGTIRTFYNKDGRATMTECFL